MTETKSTDRTARRQTMADVSHVHRYDPGASARVYSRGPTVVTDGGEPREHNDRDEETEEAGTEAETEETEDEQTGKTNGRRMKDVSHTPPTGDQEVNRVFERGMEGHDANDE